MFIVIVISSLAMYRVNNHDTSTTLAGVISADVEINTKRWKTFNNSELSTTNLIISPDMTYTLIYSILKQKGKEILEIFGYTTSSLQFTATNIDGSINMSLNSIIATVWPDITEQETIDLLQHYSGVSITSSDTHEEVFPTDYAAFMYTPGNIILEVGVRLSGPLTGEDISIRNQCTVILERDIPNIDL